MKKRSNFLVIPVLILLMILGTQLLASDPSELNPFLKKSSFWKCTTQDKLLPLNIYFVGGNQGPDGSEVIVYLKNSAWERNGQESDLSILSDYIQKQFIVITIDFGNDKQAVSPSFDKDLHEIFKAVYGFRTESILKDLNLKPNEFRCFFLPEGYRVATNLVYWEIDKHATFGTMEYIMNSYNEDIVPKLPGLEPVTSPMDMVDRYGNPFDFAVKMDIVYPSQPKKKIPAIIFSAWLASRNPNGEPISYLPHFAGFTTRGYVYVDMGHCFNPCVQHFFHFSKFTLDHWNGLACYSAAVRYINANAEKYSINSKHLGMAGHSKGQYAITRLSDLHHETGKEASRFEDFPEGSPEPQPWQGNPSNISVGYQSMGMGLFELEYITPDYVPTIVACGANERDVISKEGHPAFVNRLEELDCNYINLFMLGLGHEVPYGYDKIMGVDRYQLMHDFFDRYLKVEDKLSPVVLLVSPRDHIEDVSVSAQIVIDFAPVIDANSIVRDKGVRMIQMKNTTEVEGKWIISHGGTRFTFKPYQNLINNEKYNIYISSKVKDLRGVHLAQEKTLHFTVAPE